MQSMASIAPVTPGMQQVTSKGFLLVYSNLGAWLFLREFLVSA